MGKTTVKINAKSFGNTFNKSLDSSKFKNSAFDIMEEIYLHAKDRLLQEFDNHPVTKELEEGATADNSSGTLDGYGNLYSFLGFDSDKTNPIIELRQYLEESFNLKQTVRKDNRWYFAISCPTREEIASHTPMEWEEGNSWVEGVEEEGISNLSNYMYKSWETSRSKEGLQIPFEYRQEGTFHTTPYLLSMLEEFRDEINQK